MHINYWQEIKTNSLGRIGMVLLVLVVGAALLAPVLASFNPFAQTPDSLEPPSRQHLLGTNDVGQDILSRLLYGARTSFVTAVAVAFAATALSLAAGATAGLIGGHYEKLVMRLVDGLLVVPPMLVVIIAAAYIQPGMVHLVLLLSLLGWPAGARIIRAQTLALKEKIHVRASRTFGAGPLYVIKRHIIPDLGPVLTANFIRGARRAVFMEAGLSFLGVTDPMTVSWGKMLYHSLKYVYLDVWQWWLLPVGMALSLTVLSFTLIGYSLEEAMDPRLRREKHA